jgi:hypothetical protein
MGKTMKKYAFALSLGIAGLVLGTVPANAEGQPRCAMRDAIVAQLATGYGETRQGIGLAANNSVMEIFASDETGTWTITVTLPSGVTCLLAAGRSFERLAEKLPAKGSPV